MKVFVVLLGIMLISGCASYSNLNDGRRNNLGGGFQDKEVAPGLFHIVAKTNWAPWRNMAGAHKTFTRRATELCGDKFVVIQISESSYEPFSVPGYPPYIISQVEGYVLSSRSKLTEAKARELAKKESTPTAVTSPPAQILELSEEEFRSIIEKIRKIELGMSREAVVALLGDPQKKNMQGALSPPDIGVPVLLPGGGGVYHWEFRSPTHKAVVDVQFDRDGHVSASYPDITP